MRANRRDLTVAALLFSTHQLGESLVPVIVGATVGAAAEDAAPGSLAWRLGLLAADFLLLSLSYRFAARASVRARQHTEHQLRLALTDRVLRPAGGVRLPPGDLLSRASSDAERVGAFARTLATTVAATVVLLATTALLLRISVGLGALVVGGTAALLAAQNRLSRVLRRTSAAEQAQQARATELAEDLVRGLRVLKGIGAERAAADDYTHVSREAVRAGRTAVRAEAVMTSTGVLLTGLYLCAVTAVAGGLALDGRIGLGQLIAVLGLAQFLIGPMRVVSAAPAGHARAIASAARIHNVLSAPPAVTETEPATDAVELRAPGPEPRTTIAEAKPPAPAPCEPSSQEPLPETTPPAPRPPGTAPSVGADAARPRLQTTPLHPPGLDFHDVALTGGLRARWTVPGGTMTGLTCDDPAVAAEIAQLLAREGDPASGRILVGSTDLRALPLETLRTTVLVGHHEADLLPGTIADNLGALAVHRTAVDEAAHASLADQVIATTKYGADTTVGDRGETLSGGQRQRLALGRALAARSLVLVLHDPTTAVDTVTEDVIATRVRDLRARRTTLVITSSPAWLARCDKVIHVTTAGGIPQADAAQTDRVAGRIDMSAAHRETGKAATR
ncbi:ABC transporter ATP-binding protein [Streptomyces aureus]|uniref:ABC transporter ATP-binding protein n=1 Tax=Streptomyces aureus TaxID=193461 RepID=UPI003409AAB4